MTFITHGFGFQWYWTYERGYATSGSPLRFMLRRSSLVECVSVLHGTCLKCVGCFFYVQPCLSKNPKYTFYTIKSSLALAYKCRKLCLNLWNKHDFIYNNRLHENLISIIIKLKRYYFRKPNFINMDINFSWRTDIMTLLYCANPQRNNISKLKKWNVCLYILKEKLEDIKEVIRSRKWKDRQYAMVNRKRTNSDLRKTWRKTKEQAKWFPLKIRVFRNVKQILFH